MANPTLKQASPKLSTAKRPSIVNISISPPFQYFCSKADYENGGLQSLRRGLTVHHLSEAKASIGDTHREIITFQSY